MTTRSSRTLSDGTTLRFLAPGEGDLLGQAITVAYGDSYDADWVYDAAEVDRRLAEGLLVSCVAEAPDGSLLCHVALSRASPDAGVAEAGQAVTTPAARGHHLFTTTKGHLADWAKADGLLGIFSEATTAHPFSERANVDLGAHEAGFLLGWIPASVTNDAARDRLGRMSAALFYLKTNDGHSRPVYVPDRHRDVVSQIIEACGLRGEVTEAPQDLVARARSVTATEVRSHHNLAIITVHVPGVDLAPIVQSQRDALFAQGLDAVYVDLPLDVPETEVAGEQLAKVGVSFSGVFPNRSVTGDVLRLQSLNGATIEIGDIATASDHGRALLEYVVADMHRAGSILGASASAPPRPLPS